MLNKYKNEVRHSRIVSHNRVIIAHVVHKQLPVKYEVSIVTSCLLTFTLNLFSNSTTNSFALYKFLFQVLCSIVNSF